jgi:AraC-like DNA-binding protein
MQIAVSPEESIQAQSTALGQRAIYDALFRHGGVLLKAKKHRVLADVVLYVQLRITEPITLKAVADAVGLEACSLSRMCSRDLGITFKTFLNALRVYSSALYLLDEERTVESVAKAVGFRDESGFSRVFKHIIGLSPSTFRRVTELAMLHATITTESGVISLNA